MADANIRWSQMSNKSGWVASNWERYERFKNNMMHGEDWSQGLKFFAIYWIAFRQDDGNQRTLHFPMFENTKPKPGNVLSTHAEESLLEHLTILLSGFDCRRIVSIRIMQDASPCNRCCERYQQALEWLLRPPWSVKITIVFSALYKVLRPSCVQNKHCRGHLVDVDKYRWDNNLLALKELTALGFDLVTTGFDDWQYLRSALQLPPLFADVYELSARKREDDSLRTDVATLLHAGPTVTFTKPRPQQLFRFV